MKLQEQRQIRLRSAIMLAVTLFCFDGIVYAQSNGIPGTWKRVPALGFSYASFIDSLHGIAMSDSFEITSDGGKSWNTLTSTRFAAGVGGGHAIVCTGISKAVVEKTNCDQFEIDGDSVIQADCPQDSPDSFYQTYTSFDQKMYDTSYGFRFVQEVQRGSILDKAYIAVTHDCWRTYQAYGDSLIGEELSTNAFGGSSEINGVTIVDSNEVWVGINNTIYRTTNAGITWDTLRPFANTSISLTAAPNQCNIIINKKTHEVYVNLATKPVDYLYSSDYGKTWAIDSVFKGHIVSMFVVSPGVIWAELQAPCYCAYNNLTLDLAYSSNNGLTWLIDSTSFKIDSVLGAMYWLDERHGWINADDFSPPMDTTPPQGFIWYYDADGNADVLTSIVGIKYGAIQIYPDPATTVIYMEDLYPALQIYDPLGRKYPVNSTGNAIDISSFPPGVYFLYDGVTARAKFVKE